MAARRVLLLLFCHIVKPLLFRAIPRTVDARHDSTHRDLDKKRGIKEESKERSREKRGRAEVKVDFGTAGRDHKAGK